MSERDALSQVIRDAYYRGERIVDAVLAAGWRRNPTGDAGLWAVVTIADAEALRAHLDALNEAGIDGRAVGRDARDEPFLIQLAGPYADTEVVIYGNPWDSEVDYGTGRYCDECTGQNLHGIESLDFPVTILRAARAADGGDLARATQNSRETPTGGGGDQDTARDTIVQFIECQPRNEFGDQHYLAVEAAYRAAIDIVNQVLAAPVPAPDQGDDRG